MAKKKRREPEEEGSGYSWMDTYGDMVTLLLCFFVLLYSFSTTDAQKWQQLVSAFSGSSSPSAIESLDVSEAREEPISTIDSMVDYENRNDANDGDGQKSAVEESFDALYANIKSYITTNGLSDELSVSKVEDTIILRFGEVFLFNSGDAALLPSGYNALQNIVNIIALNKDAIKIITIEGNTDNQPIKTAKYEDNWDLSVTRATNVLRTVQAYGTISASKLAAVGYGEYQPIDTNSTPEGRARNRRVDFVIQRAPDLDR